MGPWLLTKDDLPNPDKLDIRLLVNGQQRQHSNTSNLVFDVPILINFLFEIITLEPGDVICTGTPGGVGFAMEPKSFLQDGDEVRIDIEGIGSLQNRIKAVLTYT